MPNPNKIDMAMKNPVNILYNKEIFRSVEA